MSAAVRLTRMQREALAVFLEGDRGAIREDSSVAVNFSGAVATISYAKTVRVRAKDLLGVLSTHEESGQVGLPLSPSVAAYTTASGDAKSAGESK